MSMKPNEHGFMINNIQRPPLIVASSVEPKEIEWLWYPYIPYGAASLLFGPGGTGKSHIAVEIAARLSNGEPLPGQTGHSKPQRILMMSAEDDFDTILVPRLMRAGANLANVAFPETPFILTPDGVKAMLAYMKFFDASIVFIDPIVHYIGPKVDMNKSNEVRASIGQFHQLAKDNHMAVIIVGHSRKGQEGEDYEKAMGSVDFNNAVRSVMYTTKTPDGQGRVMKHVKANYSALGPAQGYRFGEANFEWTGAIDDPDDMIGRAAPRRGHRRASLGDELVKFLKAGPRPSKDVEQHVADLGINPRSIQRAKLDMGIESFMVWRAGKPVWYMRLHGDKTEIPSVDDGDENGTGRHTLVRPADGGEVHPTETRDYEGPDRSVDAGGSGRGSEPSAKPDAKAIAAAFLSRTVGGAQ